jgi:hypothetical protein
METNDQIQDQEVIREKVELPNEFIHHLDQISRWTTFFSVMGFILVGILLIFAFFSGRIFSAVTHHHAKGPALIMSLVYVLMAVIYFFPVVYLYRFSSLSRRAIRLNDPNEIVTAFKNLKWHFQFVGIVTIVVLLIYLLVGIGFSISAFLR